MNPENYKTKRKGQPKRNNKVKGSKRHIAPTSKQRVSYNLPHLHASYDENAEWVKKVIPKLKE